MTRFVHRYPVRLRGRAGRSYVPSVYAERRPDRKWEAWIEFVDERDGDVLVTPRESTQPDLAQVRRWARGLGAAYLEGAFARAQRRSGGPVLGKLAKEWRTKRKRRRDRDQRTR